MADRIFIVEDHDWLREMLTEYIDHMPGMMVCGAVASGEEALAEIPAAQADLVLVDLTLPRMSGVDVVRQVAQRWPALPCVVLSAHSGPDFVESAFAAGALGYLRKDNPADLEQALRTVLQGQRYDGRADGAVPPGTGP